MINMISNDWNVILKEEMEKIYFQNLLNKIKEEYKTNIVYPKFENIFYALKKTSYKDVLVVILGQDPYHNFNQAHGLSFSVNKDVSIPSSLNNIYKELCNDIKMKYPKHGNLELWTQQGVLLLNTVLTVRENKPGSHKNLGWEKFTDNIIYEINKKREPVVFILWGNYAKEKEKLINTNKHLILKAPHPSPLSAYRGFFGCKHFSKTNTFLKKHYNKTIDWQI